MPERIRPHRTHLVRKLGTILSKLCALRRRQIKHLHALTTQPDLIQQLLSVLHSAFCVEITFQVMTLAFQSTGHHHTVGTVLESA
jgi:hypothetical protein